MSDIPDTDIYERYLNELDDIALQLRTILIEVMKIKNHLGIL